MRFHQRTNLSGFHHNLTTTMNKEEEAIFSLSLKEEKLTTSLAFLARLFRDMTRFNQHNKHHEFDVMLHCIFACQHCFMMHLPADVQLAALVHDYGKTKCYHEDKDGQYHFYKETKNDDGSVTVVHHEGVTADDDFLWTTLGDIGFEVVTIERAKWYARHHGDTIAPTKKAINRYVNKIIDEAIDKKLDFFMSENVWEIVKNLLKLQIADCRAKTSIYYQPDIEELQKCIALIDEMCEEAKEVHVHDLLITGEEIMEITGLKEGPIIGKIFRELLEQVKNGKIENEREALKEFVSKIDCSTIK